MGACGEACITRRSPGFDLRNREHWNTHKRPILHHLQHHSYLEADIFWSGLGSKIHLPGRGLAFGGACASKSCKDHAQWSGTAASERPSATTIQFFHIRPSLSISFIASSLSLLHNHRPSLDLWHKITVSKSNTFPPSQPLVPPILPDFIHFFRLLDSNDHLGHDSVGLVCLHILSFSTILIVTDNFLQSLDIFHTSGTALNLLIPVFVLTGTGI